MIFLVGESANREMTYAEAEVWCSGNDHLDVLLSWGAFRNGCRYSELGARWDASLNLLPPGSAWDKGVARETARAVMRYIKPRVVLLAGRRVSRAFGLEVSDKLPFLTSQEGVSLLSLPHPSGRSRCWNDPEMARRCADLWQEALESYGRELSPRPVLTSSPSSR